MEYIAIPTIKGQITLPLKLRNKYSISKKTPISIMDQGEGVLLIKILEAIPPEKQEKFKEARELARFNKAIDELDVDTLLEISRLKK